MPVTSQQDYTYLANTDENILSEVTTVHCVLFPKTLLVAGYNKSGRLLVAHYNRANDETPDWDTHFFEQDFINEKLLGVPQQVQAIFIGAEEYLMVPRSLYQEKEASEWLKTIFTTPPNTSIQSYYIKSLEAHYLFAFPSEIAKLLHRYFGTTKLLPATGFHFQNQMSNTATQLYLLLTQDKAISTLYKDGQLQMHHHSKYNNPEELVFTIAQLCQAHQINLEQVPIECALLRENCTEFAADLACYLPNIKWQQEPSGSATQNTHLEFLAQKLYACAL